MKYNLIAYIILYIYIILIHFYIIKLLVISIRTVKCFNKCLHVTKYQKKPMNYLILKFQKLMSRYIITKHYI